MANLGDISKINLPNGNVVNIKDTTARAQANWNTNNGVKNLSPISGGTVASVGRVAKMPCNIPAGTYVMGWVSTATSGSSVITFYKNGTQIAQGGFTNSTSYSTTSITLTDTANEIELYTNTANTISNVMICPKSLYDADTTYEPYALPNTKITPELIELVDSGAKNLLPINSVTSALNYFDITVNIKAGTYVVYFGSLSTTDTSSTHMQVAFYKVPDRKAFVGIEVGTNKYGVVTIPEDIEIVRVYPTASATTSTGYSVTFSNMMICSKSAWDVSQKYVPYGMSNAELTKLMPTIKSANGTIGTDYTLISDCTQTLSPVTIARISATLSFNASAPRGLILSTSNSSTDYDSTSKLLAKVEETDKVAISIDIQKVNYTGADQPIYIWAKSSSSGINRVYSSMQYLGEA